MFRHRERQRRKPSRRVDLSLVCDPLMAAAGCYTPESPLSPSASSHSERNSFDFAVAKPGFELTPMTPPMSADDKSDSETDEMDVEETLTEPHLLLHTRVYALAEKYDIPTLKQLALHKFERTLACNFDSPEVPAAIEEVYCSTIVGLVLRSCQSFIANERQDEDRGLRDIVCEAFRCHPALASTQDIHELISEIPSLSLDLFKLERGIPVGQPCG